MSEHWLDGLDVSDTLKSNETLRQSDSLESALGRVPDLRKQLSSALIPPGESATDEQRQKFNSRIQEMGFIPKDKVPEADEPPESADGYTFEPLPDDDSRKDSFTKFMENRRKTLHEQGLGKKAAESVLKADREQWEKNFETMLETANNGREALRDHFGDNYKTAMAAAEKASEYLGGVVGLVMENGETVPLEANAKVMDMLSKEGAGLGEDGTKPPSGGGLPVESLDDLRLQRDLLAEELNQLPKDKHAARTDLAKKRAAITQKIDAIMKNDPSIAKMPLKDYLQTQGLPQ